MAGLEVIIPAYNEERTVAAVVAAARACPLVERVVVVDDGSTDRTAEIARRAGAEVVRLRPNRGKTAAILAGGEATSSPILILLDGDLLGLPDGGSCEHRPFKQEGVKPCPPDRSQERVRILEFSLVTLVDGSQEPAAHLRHLGRQGFC